MLENYTSGKIKSNQTGGVLIAAFEGWNDACERIELGSGNIYEKISTPNRLLILKQNTVMTFETRPLYRFTRYGRQVRLACDEICQSNLDRILPT